MKFFAKILCAIKGHQYAYIRQHKYTFGMKYAYQVFHLIGCIKCGKVLALRRKCDINSKSFSVPIYAIELETDSWRNWLEGVKDE